MWFSATGISTEYRSVEHTPHFLTRVVATSCELRVLIVLKTPLPEAPQLGHSTIKARRCQVLQAHEASLGLCGIFALHVL
jgi:hypothetical protein